MVIHSACISFCKNIVVFTPNKLIHIKNHFHYKEYKFNNNFHNSDMMKVKIIKATNERSKKNERVSHDTLSHLLSK